MIIPFPFHPFSSLAVILLSALFVLQCSTSTSTNDGGTPGDLPDQSSNRLSVGSSAADFIRDDEFSSLVIEIQFQGDATLLAGSIDAMIEFAQDHTTKPGGVQVLIDGPLPTGRADRYTFEELTAIEQQNRAFYNTDSALKIYFLIVDGVFDGAEPALLGKTYYNTSAAVFLRTILDQTENEIEETVRKKLETTILKHSLGRMLGLVGNGTPMVEDHQQDDFYCDEHTCLMHSSMGTVEVAEYITEFDSVPELDEQCMADLHAKGL